jgi:hypothetical protein
MENISMNLPTAFLHAQAELLCQSSVMEGGMSTFFGMSIVVHKWNLYWVGVISAARLCGLTFRLWT